MDGGSDQLFSRTGFPKDKDRCVRRSNLLRPVQNILEAVALPDNILKLVLHFVLLTEVNIFGHELVFYCIEFSKSLLKFFLRQPFCLFCLCFINRPFYGRRESCQSVL